MPLINPVAAQLAAIARRARGIGPISTENKWNGLRDLGELGSIDPIAIEKASWDASDPAIKATRPALEGWMQEAGEIGHCIIEQTTDYHNFSDAPYAVYFIGTKPVFSEVFHEDTSGDATMVKERLLGRPALKVVVAADEDDPAGHVKWARVEFGHYGENGFTGRIVSFLFLKKIWHPVRRAWIISKTGSTPTLWLECCGSATGLSMRVGPRPTEHHGFSRG